MKTLEERVSDLEKITNEVLHILEALTTVPEAGLEEQHQAFVERIRAAKR